MRSKIKFNIFTRTINLLWKVSPKYFIVIAILSALSGLMSPVGLFVWQNIVNTITRLLHSKESTALSFMLILPLIIYFLTKSANNILLFSIQYIQRLYAAYIEKHTATMLFSQLSTFNLSMYDDSNLYDEIRKADSETSTRTLGMIQILFGCIQYITNLLGTISILCSLSSIFVILCIVSSIPVFLASIKMMQTLYSMYSARCERMRLADALKDMLINYNSVKEVKIFKCSSFLLNKLEGIYNKNIVEDKKAHKKLTILNSGISTLDNLFSVLIKTAAIYLSIVSALEIGTLLMYVSAIDTVKETTKNLLSLFSSAYEDCLYLQSFFFIMDQQIAKPQKKVFSGQIDKIEFRNVTFYYPHSSKPTLQNVCFTLTSNKVYALIGLNGSGKTTLIKLLCNLYQPSSGQILINGVDIQTYNEESIIRHVSAIFQDYIRYPLTLRENIGIGNTQQINNDALIMKHATVSGISNFINTLPQKLETIIGKCWTDGTDLSGGQWQKIAIARGLIKDSDLLILDEPNAALDVSAEHHLFDAIEAFKDNHICVFTTHRIENLQTADEIIVLDDGKIESKGQCDELIHISQVYQTMLNSGQNNLNTQ